MEKEKKIEEPREVTRGTLKQVKWANKIKVQFLDKIAAASDLCTEEDTWDGLRQVYNILARTEEAEYFIDRREKDLPEIFQEFRYDFENKNGKIKVIDNWER